uniref:Astacin domain-containing protein n=1 Tax=Parastrongyloides trichosuri TaxID=131310 RepID=A0A0N4ZLZ8_PARTI
MWNNILLFVVYFFYYSLQDEINDDKVNLTQLVKNFTRPTLHSATNVVLICNENNTLSNSTLMNIIDFFSNSTCVQFRSVTISQIKNGFKLKKGTYNNLRINKFKNLTTIQLNDKCSKNDLCIKYFLGLALGMIPQVNREDRDNYVAVFSGNIGQKNMSRFRKLNDTLFINQNYSFDFGSFFNRNPYYCSINSSKTCSSRSNTLYYDRMLGQKNDYSFADRRTFCNYYNIKTLPTVTCQNGGFYNPNTSSCICPDGYIGVDCSKLQETSNCGRQVVNATKDEQYMFACGKRTCYYEITKDEQYMFACGKRTCYYEINSLNKGGIEMEILFLNTKNITPCIPYYALEVRYSDDKGVTGLSLCGLYTDKISLTTPSDKVFVGYNGRQNDSFFMLFKASTPIRKLTNKSSSQISIKGNYHEGNDLNKLDCPELPETISLN